MGLGNLFSSASVWGNVASGASNAASSTAAVITGVSAAGNLAASLSKVATGLTAVGSVMAAGSQRDSGDAAKNTAEYNARINEINAEMLEDEAKAVKESTRYKVAQMAREHRRFLSIQKTRYAKAGVVLDSGSPLLNFNQTAYLSAMDRFMTGYAGDIEATQLTNKANILRSNAGFARYQGSVAQSTAYNQATGTLISGLGKLGSQYLSLNRPGTYTEFF